MKQSARVQLFLLILFFLSGATGLIYEVVWQRMLILVFGNTTYATTTVVASFLGGMAAGSFYFGRFADTYTRPLRLYAYLEAGIGIFAILSPFILSAMPAFYVALYRHLPDALVLSGPVRFAFSFLILLVPSFLMGGTLPVVSRFFIQRFDKLGWGVGSLYGVNTLGGVVGAFCAALFLLTWLGVRETIYFAAGINILIAGIVLGFDRLRVHPLPTSRIASEGAGEATKAASSFYPRYIPNVLLAVYALSGFCSLAYEILWTRVLVFYLGNSTHAFATMLSTFLLGLGLGSLIFSKFLDRSRNLLLLLAFIQVFIGLTAMLSVWELDKLWAVLDYLKPKLGGSWGALIGIRYLGALFIMFIPTLLIGLAFPLVNRIYARDLSTLGRTIGNIWSANALGWIAGAFVAGFVLIPAIGISKSIMAIALVNIALGGVIAFSNLVANRKVRWAPMAIAFILVAGLATTILSPNAKLQRLQPGEELVYYDEGASASVAVVQKGGLKSLKVNGSNEVPTTYSALRTFHMLGHLPLMLHRDPKNVLVLTFGAGIASGAVAQHELEQIDVVEISREAIEASNFFLTENKAVLYDPRVQLIIDDGRNYLLRTDNHYDVITSDATHPLGGDSWVLYTREFYELSKKRLNPDGIMTQWLPLHMIAPADYKAIIKTFQSVFPETSLWYTNDYTLMLGSMNELTIDFTLLKQRFQNQKVKEDLTKFHLGTPYSFLSSYIMGKEALLEYTVGVEINSDHYPFVEPPRRRTRRITTPQNLIDLEQSVESVFPLLTNLGSEADSVESTVARYHDAGKHTMRGRFFASVGRRDLEIREYQTALNLNPADGNARYLLGRLSNAR